MMHHHTSPATFLQHLPHFFSEIIPRFFPHDCPHNIPHSLLLHIPRCFPRCHICLFASHINIQESSHSTTTISLCIHNNASWICNRIDFKYAACYLFISIYSHHCIGSCQHQHPGCLSCAHLISYSFLDT
jgi:hypothetical protein